MITKIQIESPLTGLALVAGFTIGALFYGGLWSTVCRAVTSRSPALVILFSFTARTAAALCAVCIIAQGRPERLAACMVGFVIAKKLVVRRVAPVGRSHAYQPR